MHELTQNITVKSCNLHPALGSLIRHIVIIEADFENIPVNMVGNFMPSPDQAIFINLFTKFKAKKSDETNFDTRTSCTIIGPQITPFKLLVQESHKAISIIFQPGGLNRLLGIPMTEMFDNGFCGREVIGKEINELIDKCHHTHSLDELENIVQYYFLSKLSSLKEQLPIDSALQYLLVNYNADIGQIASMACMSIRSFERKCKERLGMSAKMFARIARFHKVYKILEDQQNTSWANLAYGAGYFDQMHFIKDFKEFAKLTPTLVQKELSEGQMRFQLDWGRI
jgi:AraC-like DNA-binding protein